MPTPPDTVMTVLGCVSASELGMTLAHEHLFLDGTAYLEEPYDEESRRAASAVVSAATRGLIARHSCVNRDNLFLHDLDLAISEAAAFADVGGRTIVDVTPENMHRSPVWLQEVATATGLNIIAGCGPYCEYSLSARDVNRTIDEIESSILTDLEVGIDESQTRAGVIGEIGVNGQLRGEGRRTCLVTPAEERGLRAAARASLRTGVPLIVHVPNVPLAVNAIAEILESEALEPDRVCLGHMSSVLDLDLHIRTIKRGYWIAYDNFGMNVRNRYMHNANDSRRTDWLLRLLRLGYAHSILVSHDVWSKIQLARFGGGGYSYFTRVIAPQLMEGGADVSDVLALTVGNPQRFFGNRGKGEDMLRTRAASSKPVTDRGVGRGLS